jgi:hypothetical protein
MMEIQGVEQSVVFLVIKEDAIPILGKASAKALEVLKIGIEARYQIKEVNQLNSQVAEIDTRQHDRDQRQMNDVRSMIRTAIELYNPNVVSECTLKSEPEFQEAKVARQVAGDLIAPVEVRSTDDNPELEMMLKKFEEITREKSVLEDEVDQKEADARIKFWEIRSLHNEWDTLTVILKQLENQKGCAREKVNKIRDQYRKEEDARKEQEGELDSKQKVEDTRMKIGNSGLDFAVTIGGDPFK